MTALSTIRPVPGRGAETVSPKLVRASSTGKSRLTIRLPDLNSPRSPATAPASQASPVQTTLTNPISTSPDVELAETAQSGPTGQAAARRVAAEWLHSLPRKTITFVRQPKFWLACVVAVAVQVVLAFVMTPAEGVPDGQKPEQPPAPPWQKAVEEPAARIEVPAAPVNVSDEHSDTAPAVTTPMGPAFPESASDAAGQDGEPHTAGVQEQPPPAARVADNHSRTSGIDGVAKRPLAEAAGASLGGIAPFDPDVSPAQLETR